MGGVESCCDSRHKFPVDPTILRRCQDQTKRLKVLRSNAKHAALVEPQDSSPGDHKTRRFEPLALERIGKLFTLWMVEDKLVISDRRSVGVALPPGDLVAAIQLWHALSELLAQMRTAGTASGKRALRQVTLTAEFGRFVVKMPSVQRREKWEVHMYDWENGMFLDPFFVTESGIFVSQDIYISLTDDYRHLQLLDVASANVLQVMPVKWTSLSEIKVVKEARWCLASPRPTAPFGVALFGVKCATGRGEVEKVFKVEFSSQHGNRIPWTQVAEVANAPISVRTLVDDPIIAIYGQLDDQSIVMQYSTGQAVIVRLNYPKLMDGLVYLRETMAARELTYIDADHKLWHVWRDPESGKNLWDCQVDRRV